MTIARARTREITAYCELLSSPAGEPCTGNGYAIPTLDAGDPQQPNAKGTRIMVSVHNRLCECCSTQDDRACLGHCALAQAWHTISATATTLHHEVCPTQACWYAATYYKACEVNMKIMMVSPAAAAVSVDYMDMSVCKQCACQCCSMKETAGRGWLSTWTLPGQAYSMRQLATLGMARHSIVH